MLSQICTCIVFIVSFGSGAIAQTHLSYADSSQSGVVDLPTNVLGDVKYVIFGYGERFDLPVSAGSVDSVDFVIDTLSSYLGTDSVILLLVKDTILTIGTGPQHLPINTFQSNWFARIVVPYSSITPGSRTHIYLNRTVVPDSFFVIITSGLGVTNEFRGIEEPKENVQLSHSVSVGFSPQGSNPDDWKYSSEPVDGKFEDDNNNPLYAEMDIGVTYEGTDGVQVHLTPSSTAIVSPNPTLVGNPVSVSGTGTFVSAEIRDVLGRVVRTLHGDSGTTSTELPTQGLPAGVYNAVLHYSDGTESSVRFVIE